MIEIDDFRDDSSLPTHTSGPTGRIQPLGVGVVGVLGGMGPLATLDFLRKMLDLTPARCDQDHVPTVVSSIPQIPDRTAAFRRSGESPLPAMIDSARRLAAAGAGIIVVPCNTAHLWYDAVAAAIGLPMLHLVDAALDETTRLLGDNTCVGLLATDATLASGLYTNRRHGSIQWTMPTAVEMVDWVMPGIAAVKAGDVAEGQRCLRAAAEALMQRGARGVVMGCTEIPLALQGIHVGVPLVDATTALARRAVAWSLGQRHAYLSPLPSSTLAMFATSEATA